MCFIKMSLFVSPISKIKTCEGILPLLTETGGRPLKLIINIINGCYQQHF